MVTESTQSNGRPVPIRQRVSVPGGVENSNVTVASLPGDAGEPVMTGEVGAVRSRTNACSMRDRCCRTGRWRARPGGAVRRAPPSGRPGGERCTPPTVRRRASSTPGSAVDAEGPGRQGVVARIGRGGQEGGRRRRGRVEGVGGRRLRPDVAGGVGGAGGEHVHAVAPGAEGGRERPGARDPGAVVEPALGGVAGLAGDRPLRGRVVAGCRGPGDGRRAGEGAVERVGAGWPPAVVAGRVGVAHREGVRAVGGRRQVGGERTRAGDAGTAPSMEQVAEVASAARSKVQVGVGSLLGVVGCPVMVGATGAARSSATVDEAGGPALPAASTAKTERVWLPSSNVTKSIVTGEVQGAGAAPSSEQRAVAPGSIENVQRPSSGSGPSCT